MKPWFTLDRIDNETYILSEYRHWEETHCYLLCGSGGICLPGIWFTRTCCSPAVRPRTRRLIRNPWSVWRPFRQSGSFRRTTAWIRSRSSWSEFGTRSGI